MHQPTQTAFLKPGSWSSIIGIIFCGIMGPTSLAKFIPLGQNFASQFNTSAGDFGLLISLIGIPAAIFAVPSSIAVERYGAKNILLGCCSIGFAVNIGYFFMPSLLGFHLLRLVEGLVIVFTYTAAPAYLMFTTDGNRRGQAMALWSTYTPIGMALGLLIGGLFAGTASWRDTFLVQAVLFVVVGLLILLQHNALPMQTIKTFKERLQDIGNAYRNPTLLLLGTSFLVVVCVGLGTNTTLPAYLTTVHQLNLAEASGRIASVTLIMVLGSFFISYLVSKGTQPRPLFLGVTLAAMIFGTLSFYTDISLNSRMIFIALWFISSGAINACMMMLMPLVTNPEERASAAAILNQGGAIATFITPPIWLSLTEFNSWIPFAILMCGGCTLIAAMALIMLKRAQQ